MGITISSGMNSQESTALTAANTIKAAAFNEGVGVSIGPQCNGNKGGIPPRLPLPMVPYSTSDQHISSAVCIFSLAAALIRRPDKCVSTSAPSVI